MAKVNYIWPKANKAEKPKAEKKQKVKKKAR